MTVIKRLKFILLFNISILLLNQILGCNSSNNSNLSTVKSKPVAGGTFQMMLHQPHSLDPLLVSTTFECCIIEQIFNGLLKFNTNLNPVPDLAESWYFSDDKTKINFQLKQGVLFHNGRELVSQDVVYSFNRVFDSSLQVPITIKELLQSVEGVLQFQSGAADSISGFVALDDHTFQIRLTQPNSTILTLLAVNYFKVIPKEEYISTQSFTQNPVGTGPFKFNCCSLILKNVSSL